MLPAGIQTIRFRKPTNNSAASKAANISQGRQKLCVQRHTDFQADQQKSTAMGASAVPLYLFPHHWYLATGSHKLYGTKPIHFYLLNLLLNFNIALHPLLLVHQLVLKEQKCPPWPETPAPSAHLLIVPGTSNPIYPAEYAYLGLNTTKPILEAIEHAEYTVDLGSWSRLTTQFHICNPIIVQFVKGPFEGILHAQFISSTKKDQFDGPTTCPFNATPTHTFSKWLWRREGTQTIGSKSDTPKKGEIDQYVYLRPNAHM
ncbi:hypothetical protein PTTG_27296 [Puccinia triticina 1-1 BBBD Race 1]|uniref:Uncharacterized protein n=2 Tax=Puccinia triticina TaxID=208348 RepID=A0A180GLX3_PUCT1|nr:uncharacterized protein PtA15_3A575 [Puccinia triticina]OAV93504.1 hypothetical protein PTTG_27296 [Puccinia triticina 1-1 BBBD Race 1]WAQ83206.1 hypothetical protein PtA15_3A575 [Puccinia triticina]WAR54053.1 hypothetical protein PtB15_3B563 [Puccinia triticina]